MDIFYMIIFFVFGCVVASFLTVLGIRAPKKESFIKGRSHCDVCKKNLRWYELIPLISYIIQFGKCRQCNSNIKFRYFLYEFITGMLFVLSYIIFGLSLDLVICLILISTVLVVIVSDIEYMIIMDELLIVSTIIFVILNTIKNGFYGFGMSVMGGILAFIIMYSIKLLGDIMFKKESLGGGDIKFIGVLGVIFNYQAIVLNIFLASFISLPYALYITISKKDGIIPFGPFLGISSLIIFMLKLNNLNILDIIYNFI